MNGYPQGRNPFSNDGRRPSPSPPRPPGSSGRILFEGYRKDVINNFEPEAPRYNPMNPARPQSSVLVDLKDPIQVHLLTETALSDSRKYEILSQEEVDGLKKQILSLTQRIEQTKANLSLQSKYRDAATSMAKLYTPSGKRRSLLGNRGSGGDSAKEAEAERQACERRCEDLAAELWSLEKRTIDPQRRLLEHTAGVLQLTHKASKKHPQPLNGQMLNGIPGSPESLYTYSNSRNSMELPNDDMFYDGPAGGQAGSRPRQNPEIPMKSPIREQASKLREETDQLREENGRLRADADAVNLELDALRRDNPRRLQEVSDTERKLERINKSLRDVIVNFNPAKNSNYRSPPYGNLEPGEMLGSQLDYLEKGISSARQEQEMQASESIREADAAAAAAAVAMAQAEGRIEALNRQIRDLLRSVDATQPPPPNSSGSDLDDQIEYLQNSLRVVESELLRAVEARDAAQVDVGADVDTTLKGLWNNIQFRYEEIQRKRDDRRRAVAEKGIGEGGEEVSDNEFDIEETYSLPAFSTRIKTLSALVAKLIEEKSVLKRQIKQQRELNKASGPDKDAELKRKDEELKAKDSELRMMQAELDEMKLILDRSQTDASQTQGMLVSALRDLDTANKKSASDESATVQAAREELAEKSARLAALQASGNDLESRLNMTEASRKDLETRMASIDGKIESLTEQLDEATQARKSAELAAEYKQKELDAKQREAKEKDDVVENMNLMVVELKTELTIARAELDGAYGSRAERAADVAAIKNSKEMIDMQAEVDNLKAELAETIKQLEDITKETIDAEREKLEIEGKLDDAVVTRRSLETEVQELRDKLDTEVLASREKIGKLQEELDNEKLKVGTGGGSKAGASKPGAGASMLSEQFRATMREERKKFQEDLREEQARRRKVEEELARLKRAAGPGKSPLSPRG